MVEYTLWFWRSELLNQGSRRELVAALNLQFSSNVRRIREHSLEQVFISILFRSNDSSSLEVSQICEDYKTTTRNGYISTNDAEWVLRKLIQRGRVRASGENPRLYQLTESTRAELGKAERIADGKIARIVDSLFPTTMCNSAVYSDAFLRLISRIAAELGEESAAALLSRDQISPRDVGSLDSWIQEELDGDSRLDGEILRTGVLGFFRNSDPDRNQLLWQITEAYFVTRMLGLHPGGRALSQEIFNNWEFVVDTNVVIALLLNAHDDHEVVESTVKAIGTMNRPMLVADCTLAETETVMIRELELLRGFVDRNDERWLEKTDSPFLKSYAREPEQDIDGFISRYSDITSLLFQKYGMRVVKITDRGDDPRLLEKANRLKQRSRRNARDQNGKTDEVAIHDARILLYTEDRRQRSSLQIWALTLDGTLLGPTDDGDDPTPLAIHPRSVIQWLAPVVNSETVSKEFPKAFSEMIADKILPRDTFIDAGDLSLLLSSTSVRSLPDADIERVISKVRAESIRIDPTTYKGQADLGSILASVVSDPSSTTQLELEKARREAERRAQELESAAAEMSRRDEELRKLRLHLSTERSKSELNSGEVAELRFAIDAGKAKTRFWVGLACYILVSLGSIVSWLYVGAGRWSYIGLAAILFP